MNRNKDEIMAEFLDLSCALSPENLTCDGEATREDIAAKLQSIQKSWKELEDEIGYTVTEDDAWSWHRHENKRTFKKN